MQHTTNYNLNVIEQSDKILDSVDALGQNATSIDTILAGKIDKTSIATNISSSSTNDEVAGAKAVNDLVNKPYGRYVLSSNASITPNTTYGNAPQLVKLAVDVAMDSNYMTYNATTGVYTFVKAGRYKVTLRAQLRGSSNSTTNIYCMKGYCFSTASDLGQTWVACNQQCRLEDWSSLYEVGTYVASAGDTISMSAYCFVRSGTIGTYTMTVQASDRTTMEIEYIGENTTQTRGLMKSTPIVEDMEETKAEGSGDVR